MITYFPILDTADSKKKSNTFRRNLLCSNKLDKLFKRLKKSDPIEVKLINPEAQQQKIIELQQQEVERETAELVSFSNAKYQVSPEMSRKRDIVRRGQLHHSFNRTKTDWDHNFTGSKYIRKIKQQLRTTKWASFNHKEQQKYHRQITTSLRPSRSGQDRNPNETIASRYHRGLSEEQLRRIQIIKQKRRNKMQKNTSFMSIEDRKKNVEEYKDEPEQEKLAPWEDYPSRLSSMFLKKK